MRKVFGFFLLLCLTVIVGSSWHGYTAGFRMHKIQFDLPVNENWNVEISEEKKERLRSLLNQEFHYLGKGRQSYVFASRDGNYVIKFFRYHLVRPRFGLYLLQFPKFLNEYREYRLNGKRQQFENWMKSYKLAYKEVREETGLEYVHLTKTHNFTDKLVIRDSLNRKYFINLDQHGFLLQKRVKLLQDQLESSVKNQDEEKMKRIIKGYVKTITQRHQKGIKNKDSALHNYGFLPSDTDADEIYEIDVGRFSKQSPSNDYDSLVNQIFANGERLKEYLECYMPSLVSVFDEYVLIEAKKYFYDSELSSESSSREVL